MTVPTVKEAWDLANRLFPDDYDLDEDSRERCGYPIYVSTKKGSNASICDLNTRLELNYDDGKSENIWIEENLPTSYPNATIGVYREVDVFVGATVKEVQEDEIRNVIGITVSESDEGLGFLKLHQKDNTIEYVSLKELAYVKL